jgi:hypothetical protein
VTGRTWTHPDASPPAVPDASDGAVTPPNRPSLADIITATSSYVQSDGPNEVYPGGGFVPQPVRRSYLAAALAGVELGAYDTRIVGWLAQWDDYTARLVVSLLVRARIAGYAEAAGGRS